MTLYLVDNSAWVRYVAGDLEVRARLDELERSPSDLLVTCPPQVLEFCYGAPSLAEHDAARARIRLGLPLERHPDERMVLDVQRALWAGGLVRAAGAMDVLIAAYAILNDAVVLSCHRDFNHIASVTDLQHEYVAPIH